MAFSIRSILRCAARGVCDTVKHDGIEHAGYLAFLGLLALFPFLVFIVSVVGAVGPETEVTRYITSLFGRLPPDVIRALQPRVEEIVSGPPQGLLTIAILGAVWMASSAVEGLRTILNRAYCVHTPPHYVLRRLLSILQMLLFAFVLIVGMLLLITLPALFSRAEWLFGLPDFTAETRWWSRVIYLFSQCLLLAVVGGMYWAIPNIRQRWFSIWPGAVLVVLLWTGTGHLFALYLSHFHQMTLIYGSLGGIIAALLFFYLCNVIFIFGAEFNHHLSQMAGVPVVEREKSIEEPEA